MCTSDYVGLGKFNNLFITQNLWKIDFEDSRNEKSTILIHLDALNFKFFEFVHFLKTEIYQNSQIQSP